MKKLITIICAAMVGAAQADEILSALFGDNASVTAAEGETNTIAQVSLVNASYSISKTGEGVNRFGRIDTLRSDGWEFIDKPVTISVDDGYFALSGPFATQDTSVAESGLAKATLHYDASIAETIITNEDGFVTEWRDVRGDPAKSATAGDLVNGNFCAYPTVQKWEPNGEDVIDFGDRSGDGFASTTAAWMQFPGNFFINGFLVMKEKTLGSGAFYLGGRDWWQYQFHRSSRAIIGWSDGQTQNAINANWHVDGLQVGSMSYAIDDQYHVISFSGAESYASTFCNDRDGRGGGWQIAEVILFNDSSLTSDEYRAIESMLMRKWLNRSHPVETAKPLRMDALTFGSQAEAIVDSEIDIQTASLVGNGELVKKGAGTVSASTLAGINSVNVEEGRLELENSFNGLMNSSFFHIDVSATDTIVTNELGTVARINDVGGNGRYAELSPDVASGICPSIEKVTNDMPALGFGEFADWGGGTSTAMRWSEAAVGAKTIFAAQYRPNWSGQFFMGYSGFHPFHCSSAILDGSYSASGARSAKWYINGESIDPLTEAFPNEFCVYTVTNLTDVTVDQFAQDRSMRYGGIYIGEVLVFQRNLSPSETERIQQYLMHKWLGSGDAPDTADRYEGVAVGAGASVAFNGDISVTTEKGMEIGFPLTEGMVPVSVNGTLAFDPSASLSLTMAASDRIEAGRYEIVHADAITGLDTQTVAGSVADHYSVKLSIEDGALYATIRPSGMTVIVR